MASGPEHWTKAQEILAAAENADADASRDDIALLLKFADTHFNAARTAATALQAALPLIGDDQQITDWGRAIGLTFTTPDAVRIDDAHALLDQLGEEGLIVPATAERLREVLGKRPAPSADPPAVPYEPCCCGYHPNHGNCGVECECARRTPTPSAEDVEELAVLIYESGVIDDSLSAAGGAESLAEALLKAGVRLPAATPDGGE